VCCNTACSGVCEGCGANGSCGFRDNGRCPAGQECASQTTCQPSTTPPGGSCANGEVCENGRCINGSCFGFCILAAAGANDGSRYDQCVLGQ